MTKRITHSNFLWIAVFLLSTAIHLLLIPSVTLASETILWQSTTTSPKLQSVPGGADDEFALVHRWQNDGELTCASFSPDGTHLFACSEDNKIRVWDVNSGELVGTVTMRNPTVFISGSPDGKHVAAGTVDGKITIFEIETGSETMSMMGGDKFTTGRYSPDGRYILTGDLSGSLIFWDPKTGERVFVAKHKEKRNGDGVFHLKSAFSPDGRYAAAVAFDKQLTIYHGNQPKVLRKLKTRSKVWAFVFSTDGNRILTALDNGKVALWDCASGKLIETYDHNISNGVMSIDLSPDEKRAILGTGFRDKTAIIWSLDGKYPIVRLSHGALIRHTVFSPDGRCVLTYSSAYSSEKPMGKDWGVRIWDPTTGDLLLFMPDELFVWDLSTDRVEPFSPDGRYFFTQSIKNKSISLWAYLPDSMELVQREAEFRMGHLLQQSRFPPRALRLWKKKLAAQKPASPEVLVRGKYESTAAFQERVKSTTGLYEDEVATYNRKILELQTAMENHSANAPTSLNAAQRLQCIQESYLAVFGQPVLSNPRYDADAATFFIDLTSSRMIGGGYQQTLMVDVPNNLALNFDNNLSKAKVSVEFTLNAAGLLSWKSAVVHNLGQNFSAIPIDDVSFQPIAMTAPIAQADLNEVKLSMPEAIVFDGVQLALAEDPEIASLQREMYELKHSQSQEKAKAKERARLEEGIAKLKQAQNKLRAGEFKDDLPTRLAAAPATPLDPHRFLLAVGIGDYDEVPDVPFADRSASMFQQAAIKLLGVPEENVELLTSSEATGTRIIGRLKRLLGRLEADDVLFFYYAGHGVPSKDGTSSYLLPVDGGSGSFQDPDLELTTIYQRLKTAKAGHIVCFIDACFSGRADAEAMIFKGVAPIMMIDRTPVPEAGNLTVFSAGKNDQFGNQYLERGHRLFTYYLIDGLLESGFKINELEKFLVEKVSRDSRKLGPEYLQEPQVSGNRSFRLTD